MTMMRRQSGPVPVTRVGIANRLAGKPRRSWGFPVRSAPGGALAAAVSRLPLQRMSIDLRKRCGYCHAFLDASPIELLPKFLGRPQVHCKRCGRATKLSLLVALASTAAGGVLGLVSVAVCDDALTGSVLADTLAATAILMPLGVLAWMTGYLAFATGCYGIQRGWIMLRGWD